MYFAAEEICGLLDSNREVVVDLVRSGYQLFLSGDGREGDPTYLSFSAESDARIIAKPAVVESSVAVAGVKWISSFPSNTKRGLPRASGVLILNSAQTGLPIAVLDAAAINLHRTAASAILGLRGLYSGTKPVDTIGLVGLGRISGAIARYILDSEFSPMRWMISDINYDTSIRFAETLRDRGVDLQIVELRDLCRASDVIVFATTATKPYVHDADLFRKGQLVIHISLRDLDPAVILQADNFTDSSSIAFSRGTSLELAEKAFGHRRFLKGDIGSVLNGSRTEKLGIFSPFGLGLLDLMVGEWIVRTTTSK